MQSRPNAVRLGLVLDLDHSIKPHILMIRCYFHHAPNTLLKLLRLLYMNVYLKLHIHIYIYICKQTRHTMVLVVILEKLDNESLDISSA